MSIAATTNLHCFLILPKVLIKSNHLVSTKEPLIDYNKNTMMTSEDYVVVFQQKFVKKEATTQKWDV
jgi:hypothetical protein